MAVYTEVADDEIARFAESYGIGEVLSFKGIAEGVENSNYLVVTGNGQYILTLYEKRVDPADLPFFLGLMEQLPDHEVKELCSYLVLPRKVMHRIWLARNGYKYIERRLFEKQDNLQNSDIYNVFKKLPLETILYRMAKTKQEFVKKAASLYLSKLQDIPLEVSGKDLIALGLPPGPIFQEVLKTVHTAKLNGDVATREQQLDLAERQRTAG